MHDREIERRIGDLLDGYVTRPLSSRVNAMFRARKNLAGASFTHATELWYPPAALATAGRFNRAGESVFYGSTDFRTVLTEVVPQPGDLVTVVVCGSREEVAALEYDHLGMNSFSGPPQAPLGTRPNLRNSPSFQNSIGRWGVSTHWEKVDDFLCEMATSTTANIPNLYRITEPLARLLEQGNRTLGLAYPSVAAGLQAFNVRLPALVADELFYPSEAWECQILPGFGESGDGNVRLIRRTRPIAADGVLHWEAKMQDPNKEMNQMPVRLSINRLMWGGSPVHRR